jgi:release factor glutamine methyltransferase
VDRSIDLVALEDQLWQAGFVAADEEAVLLASAAGGDPTRLAPLVARRLTGEPLAWITGTTTFCGLELQVAPGVYVPRVQSEAVAQAAAAHLSERGVAVDLCTGAGALAVVLAAARPRARVVGTDIDPAAVACARTNGVDALVGDLFDPLPVGLRGRVEVVAGVVPYVPTPSLDLLQRDTLAFESTVPYDGGIDGTRFLRRAAAEAAGWLAPGGWLVLELGGEQADLLAPDLAAHGYVAVVELVDEDGDVRGIEARLA